MSKYVWLKEEMLTEVISSVPVQLFSLGLTGSLRWWPRIGEEGEAGRDVAWPFVTITIQFCQWQWTDSEGLSRFLYWPQMWLDKILCATGAWKLFLFQYKDF